MSKSRRASHWLSGSFERLFRDESRSPRSRQKALSRRFELLEQRELLSLSVGPEFRVNNVIGNAQQTYAESNRTVAMNGDGRQVVVWSSFGQDQIDTWGVINQVYNESNNTVGGNAVVNQTVLRDQRYPTIGMADNGSYVVTWTSNQTEANGFDIYARRFNSTGSAQGGDILVNTTVAGDQRYSRIAVALDGSFVVTWTSGEDGSGDVFFQRYNASGVAQGSETRINQTTGGDQSFSTVVINPVDGSYTFTYSSNQNGAYDIFFRRFNASGSAISAETRVNTTLAGNQTWSDIGIDPFGNFTVTWTSDSSQDGDGKGVFVKLYTPTGIAVSGDIMVNNYSTDDQENSTIAVDANGNFVIAWESDLQDTGGWGIYAQRFNFFGFKVGDEILVNSTTTGDQRFPTVASDANGDFMVVWSAFGQVGGSDWDIYARRYTQVRPDANNDSATTPKNTPVTVNVLANDTPPPGGTLNPSSVTIITPPAAGTAVVNADGSITYTPQVGFVGVVTFTYAVADTDGTYSLPATVTITVLGIPPVAGNDTATTPEDTPVAIAVLANDTDSDGTIIPSTVTIVTAPSHGTTSINPVTGVVTYTPALNYNGLDSFTYTVEDNDGQVSNIATVSITITPVNDPPTAASDSAFTNRGVPVDINVLANDTDPDNAIDPTTVTIATPPPPAAGTVTVNPATGVVTYTPAIAYFGTFIFTYTVKDVLGATSLPGTVTVRVNNPPTAVNDAKTTPEDVPVDISVLANDTDVDGSINPTTVVIVTPPTRGSVTVNGATGVVTYSPFANLNGADSFTYQVRDNDGALSNVATVNMTVLAVNDPPVAVDDPTTTDIGVPVVINILANDTDVDGTVDPTSVAIVTFPVKGTIVVNPVTGVITYTPNLGAVGGDLIEYTVKDNLGAVSNVARVPIRVGLPSTISGKVYLDRNNNGIQEGDEAGLEGVSLTLLKTDAPITFVLNATTAADGSYSFTDLIPGIYTLIQTQPGVFLDGTETPAPGIPVGSILNDEFRDITLGSGVTAAGFNFGERGIRAEFLASYAGARIFLASTTLLGGLAIPAAPAAFSLAGGDIWISIDGGWSGPLALLAQPSGGTASLTLYDSRLSAVASAPATTGTARLDYQGTSGSTYFLKVSGSSSNVTVTAFDPTPPPVNLPPALNPIGNRTAQPGQTTSFIVKAIDVNSGDHLSYLLAGSVPAGATLNQTTGQFTWAVPANFTGSTTITILVQDDGDPAANDFETFQITASQGGGGAATLTPSQANSFVQALYVDLLGRGADPGGLNAHVSRLLAGATREMIVEAFTHSAEYVGRTIDGMYSRYLHRRADSGGRSFWVQQVAGGMSENDVAAAFLNSVEYVSRHGSNAAFVDGLYRDVLGRAPDTGGMNAHQAALQSGTTRAALAAAFLASTERIDRVITEQYGQLLGRGADSAGLQWYRALLHDSESAVHELADSLLNSDEYLSRAIRRFR